MWDLRKPEGNVYCLWLPRNASNTGLRNNYFIDREICKHSNLRLFRCSWLGKGSTNIKLDLVTVGKFCSFSRVFGSVVDWVSVHPARPSRLNHGLRRAFNNPALELRFEVQKNLYIMVEDLKHFKCL